MNLVEAINSGKKFRRKSQLNRDHWFTPGDTSSFYQYQITADDWEVEQVTVPISREQFNDAWDKHVLDEDRYSILLRDRIAKELGL